MTLLAPGVWYDCGTVYYYLPRLSQIPGVRDLAQIRTGQASLIEWLFPEVTKQQAPCPKVEQELLQAIRDDVGVFLRPYVRERVVLRTMELLD